MRSSLLRVGIGALVVASAGPPGPARADFLITPYDAGHVTSRAYQVGTQGWTVFLNPINPTPLRAPTANFRTVLQTAFPTWTFNYSRPNGTDYALSDDSLVVHRYNAILNENCVPPSTQCVGADFYVEYVPRAGDPPAPDLGSNVHWIQVVQDNHGAAHGTDEDVLDNGGAALPYYDAGFPNNANQQGFIDEPRRPDIDMFHRWSAELFLVEDAGPKAGGGRVVNVYDGMVWGWGNAVPEPSSVALLTLGAALAVAARARASGRRRPRERVVPGR